MQSKSLAQTAYQEIRKRIIYGDYLPGEVLSENGLSKELEMSRTPIRDALLRLDSEGFIVTLKNRGILVKEISHKDIFDIMALNNCMLVYAAELVLNGVSSFDLDKLQLHLEKQIKASEDNNYIEYCQQSNLFGRSMIEITNNQIMLGVYDSLRDKSLRTAIVNWKLSPQEKRYSTAQRNSQIYDVIVSKEYEKIKPILMDHYVYTREKYITKGII